ncbi:MAG TPA: RluA family pseudouridine synthase [Candidatus Binatia bacterium]|jgi:23S rRNA pseudouridine1911/1915/1917 synthase
MNEARDYHVLIDARSAGSRLDLFLVGYLTPTKDAGEGLSRAQIRRLIDEGQVTVNGVRTKASARVRTNDRVDVRLLPPRATEIGAEALPLAVLYEDADCIVVNKAPGMTVHPAAGHWSGTLVNALLHHCPDLEGVGGVRRPGIVHRLDKDTSGVMIAAKNAFAYQDLVRQFKERSVEKEYLALVWGALSQDRGIIERPIGRHRSDRKRMSSVRFSSPGRAAVTEWSVEERFTLNGGAPLPRWVTLLRLCPRTGRTHQLRVHMADLGHPLVGDRVYGSKRRNNGTKSFLEAAVESFPRQALHARKLILDHPRTSLRMEFVASWADDLNELVSCLREANSGVASHKDKGASGPSGPHRVHSGPFGVDKPPPLK